MRLIEIIKILDNINRRIFSIADLSKIINSADANTIYKTAERLEKSGILKRLAKGLYSNASKPPEIFEIANCLYAPSYISLESALYRYGVIMQSPYTITSITPKKTKKKIVTHNEYEYVHVNPKYFFGYIKDKDILIATREKAFLDLFYLISKNIRRFNVNNLDFKALDRKLINGYLKYYSYRPLINILKRYGL